MSPNGSGSGSTSASAVTGVPVTAPQGRATACTAISGSCSRSASANARASTASWPELGSTPTTMPWPLPRGPAGGGTATTVQAARLATLITVDPTTTAAKLPAPCVPTTSRSALREHSTRPLPARSLMATVCRSSSGWVARDCAPVRASRMRARSAPSWKRRSASLSRTAAGAPAQLELAQARAERMCHQHRHPPALGLPQPPAQGRT